MNCLALTKLRFTLTFTRDTHLPPFIGNTLRGALGRSLDDNFRSVYSAVFKVTRHESVPNPFVISTPFPSQGDYRAGDTLEFCITLFGVACTYAENIAEAARLMNRGKLTGAILTGVERVYSRQWSDAHAETIPPCSALTLNFITPTALVSGKQPVYEPDFAVFIDSLFGRIAAIIDNYGEREFIVPHALLMRKPLVNGGYDLKRVQINSNNHPINGFVGKISYYGDVTRYLSYIDLGGQLHLGKKTTRSCGEFFVEI